MLKSKIIYLNVTKLCHSSYYRFGQAHSPNSGQNHYQVLGISRNATIEQVKSAYRELSKKHHPDVSKDPNSLEKFKQISNAYSILKDEKSRTQYDANNTYDYDKPTANTYKYSSARSQSANSSQRENAGTSRRYQSSSDKSDEEILYETIFGKTFRSDPSFYYKPENEALRKKYEEELEKLRREKGEHADYSSGAGASGYQHEDPEESREWREFMREFSKNKEEGSKGAKEDASAFNSDAFKRSPLPNWAKAILALGSGALIYVLTIERGRLTKRYESTTNDLNAGAMEVIREDYLKKREDAKEKKKADFISSLALMKRYPRRNPNATNMLVDYTIWNDVKVYHVPPVFFHGEDEDVTLNSYDFEKHRLYNTKMNTKLTLALEIERAYKNVYVKVDDVLNSLKKTGFYEPPGVFFRYFGFIYTRIRRKPIIAENLQECIKSGEKTISLFDLFFHYTTPILIANDEYYEIPLHHTAYIKDTTTREGKSWIGNAHVNFRPIEKKIVNPNEKNVFVWKGSKQLNSAHDRYMRTWGTFYDMYEKI